MIFFVLFCFKRYRKLIANKTNPTKTINGHHYNQYNMKERANHILYELYYTMEPIERIH